MDELALISVLRRYENRRRVRRLISGLSRYEIRRRPLPPPEPTTALAFAIVRVDVDEELEGDWHASIVGRTGHKPMPDDELKEYLRPAITFQHARAGGTTVVVLPQ